MTQNARRRYLVERLEAVAAGDRAALHDLYQLTSAKLYGTILRILSDRDEAEDVLQDVYLTVWNKAHRFDPSRASPVTWLSVIARNRAIDRQRLLARHGIRHSAEATDNVADDAPSPLAMLEGAEEARRLISCLESLEKRAKSAIVSAFYDGRTYDDLARAAGVPLGTMKTTIRRALQRLKLCLEAWATG